jgi:lysophospholipase L1-like esterase
MKRPNSHQYETVPHPCFIDQDLEADEQREAFLGGQGQQHQHHTSTSSSSSTNLNISLNLDAITSKKSRNSTLFTITQAGTISSRSGLYIRPSWKTTLFRHLQNRIKTYVVIFVILLSLRPIRIHLFANSSNNKDKDDAPSKDDNDKAEDDDVISFSSGGYKSFSPMKEMKNIQDICSNIHTNAVNLNAKANANANAGTSSTTSTSTQKECSCLNPMEGKEGNYPGWRNAHDMNMQMVDESYTHNKGNWDVVFLGDSIVEEWNGRWLGREGPEWNEIHTVWNELFDPSITSTTANATANATADSTADFTGAAVMKGLALGIAGDHIANLLWRIQNGELERADSKVFWVLIGTNDLTASCSEEVILLGIIHIVEEIKRRKPDSIIVLNGILPRTDSPSGKLMDVGDVGVGVASSSSSPAKTLQGQLVQEDLHTDLDTIANAIAAIENVNTHPSKSGSVSSTERERKDTSPPLPRLSHRNFWQSIQSINKGLARYAEQNDKVEYFDASGIFVAHLGNKFYQLQEEILIKELQGDFLHPTALGHKLWGEAIVDYMISDLDTPPNLRRDFED